MINGVSLSYIWTVQIVSEEQIYGVEVRLKPTQDLIKNALVHSREVSLTAPTLQLTFTATWRPLSLKEEILFYFSFPRVFQCTEKVRKLLWVFSGPYAPLDLQMTRRKWILESYAHSGDT